MATGELGTVLNHLRALAAAQAHAGASDGELLERYVSHKDKTAFALLLKRHGPMVLRLGRRVLGSEHDAEDVFQATFLLFARKAASIRKRESVSSWLYGVAYRLASRARAQRVHRKMHERQAAIMHPAEPGVAGPWQELQALLEDVLAQLPDKYRAPLVLCYLDGKTQEEAARQLGCPLGTVRSWLARGRTLLRQRLARRGVELSSGAVATALLSGAASAASAEVPARVLRLTLRAALQFAAGQEAAGLVSANVSGLVKAGLTTTVLAKFKAGATVLLALAALVTAAGVAAERVPGVKEPGPTSAGMPKAIAREADNPKVAGQAQARTDAFGDPFPPGAIKRLGTLRFRHGGGTVNCLLVSPDGKTLVSNTYYGSRTVCAWELATGKLLHQFPGHYDEGPGVALSPDGKTLAVAHDPLIRFWDLASGREVRQLKSPLGGVEGLAFSPDGKTLASGHGGQTVLLWDLAAGKVVARLPAKHRSLTLLAFTPDGKTLATGDTHDSTIRLFDVATRKQRHEVTRPKFVWRFALSPDGTLLAAGGEGTTIALRSVRTGKLVRELRGWPFVLAVAFSPDGKTLASLERDKNQRLATIEALSLWDVATGRHRCRLKAHGLLTVAFSADGKTLIAGGRVGIIRLWDVATGKERGPAPGCPGYLGCLTVAPDGRTLAYVHDDSIRLLDLATWREIGTLPTSHEAALCLAFSPDSKTLAAGVTANAIYLWDVGTHKLVRRLERDKKNAGPAWGKFLAVAFSPDGQTLASAGPDGAVRLWNVGTGQALRRLSLLDRASEFCSAEAVAFSPDGKTLAAWGTTGTGANKVRLWEVATGKQLAHLTAEMNVPSTPPPRFWSAGWQEDVFSRIAFSPDGKMLAMNRWQKTILVWEVASGKERCLLKGHEEPTVCVAFAPDGRALASASLDNTIRLWDLATGKELGKLTGHRGKAHSLAFSADGKTLVSAGDDTTLLAWDVGGMTHRSRRRNERLPADEWPALWSDLAGADASRAYRAMNRLMAAPGPTVLALKGRLRPAPAADPRRLTQLLSDLDSNQFAVREKASQELEKLAETAKPAVQQALARSPSSLELRRRLERILDKLAVPSGGRLQQLRAVEVLEHIGTAEARQILTALSKGVPEARLTQAAKATLGRLGPRP
ncbi:MAG TPA: sigma-70 family RNA polymerase sigma factor [Gemmataceae bacterium]|jgi:RNA polymerase sigma factor (sigma-70 family)|nr:sigma-70 family RNA polymerase sigma factor [Gemmataceae bacterium]